MSTEPQDPRKAIERVFGLYKAEWLNGDLFSFFTQPDYFDQLRTKRPCVLTGGRGTGKTTVLRGLSYEGQFALGDSTDASFDGWSFIGLYYRVNTNRVTALRGNERTKEQWTRLFAHYMNLQLCNLILDFIRWYEITCSKSVELQSDDLVKICRTLNLQTCGNLRELAKGVDDSVTIFEATINNISDSGQPKLSLQGAPIDALTKALSQCEDFKDKQIFFLIDEYENFEDYQQQVVNTLIKHAEPQYTFKIGVKELGWRERSTLNSHEQLTHPADYERIDLGQELAGEKFANFASRVCNSRLNRVAEGVTQIRIEDMFPGLTIQEEAELLGVEAVIAKRERDFVSDLHSAEQNYYLSLTRFERYFLTYWAQSSGEPTSKTIERARKDPEWLRQATNNHGVASLFAIRAGKRGLRKYYAGWSVLVLLASGNIRHMMELVYQSLLLRVADSEDDLGPISAQHQTNAAINVGRKKLAELEGISVEGGSLTKLVLSLGRIFQLLAANPHGHTPEVNQFHISSSAPSVGKSRAEPADRLLKEAVIHQALVRFAGNKLISEGDTREFDYMLHPVFAPFFIYSHRRKRKLTLSSDELLRLISDPQRTISEVLERNRRGSSDSEMEELRTLPDQLSLFENFYANAD